MTQAQTITENEPSIEIDTDAILEKKQNALSDLTSQETYVIKSFQNGKLVDAYDGVLDFSTEEGKNEFNVLKKLITKNNWLVVPSDLFKEFESEAVTLPDLEKGISTTHQKLSIEQPNLLVNLIKQQEEKANNDFISNVSDVETPASVKSLTEQAPKSTSGIARGEAVKFTPSDIVSSFDAVVKHKLNELNYHKSKVQKNKGKVSLNTLLAAGGVFAIGVVFSPLAALTVPTAIAIGGFAVLKGMFGQNSDIKNYDKQIDALKEATAKMVLRETGEDTKKNVANFIKNNKDLTGTLFDEKIEAEFARICKVNNVKIDTNIFKKAHQYDNGHVIDYNRNSKKPKM